MSQVVKYGFDGTINFNSGTYTSPTWAAATDVMDVAVGADMDEVDTTTRAGGGVKESEPTLVGLSLSGKVRTDQNDTVGFVAMETAFLGRSSLDTLWLDGATTTVGARGYRAHLKVFKFGEDQSNGNVLFREFEMKPCVGSQASKAVVGSGPTLAYTALAS